MTAVYIIVALMVGVAMGVLLMCIVAVNTPGDAEDSERLNTMETLKWQASTIDGKWAVLHSLGGKMTMICKPQPTLREAIDAALEPKRG